MSSHKAPPILSLQSLGFSRDFNSIQVVPGTFLHNTSGQPFSILYTVVFLQPKYFPTPIDVDSQLFPVCFWFHSLTCSTSIPLYNTHGHLLRYTLGSCKCLLVNILICLHWVQLSICLPLVYSQSLVIPSQIFPSQVLANLLFFVICVIILIGKPKCLFYTILMYLNLVINSFLGPHHSSNYGGLHFYWR